MWFDIACDHPVLGFSSLRVYFDQDPRWPEAERFNTDEPVTVGMREHQLFVGPAFTASTSQVQTPVLQPLRHEWGWQREGAVIVADPLMSQVAITRVCGRHGEAEETCFDGSSVGRIVAATAGMTHSLYRK